MRIIGYRVDVTNETISEVSLTDDFRDIYKYIAAEGFDTVRLNTGLDTLFVDDVGLLKTGRRLFGIEGYGGLLAGHGLVLGMEPNGETARAPKMPLDEFKRMVSFTDKVT